MHSYKYAQLQNSVNPPPGLQSTRILDQLRKRIRYVHYSLSTDQVYRVARRPAFEPVSSTLEAALSRTRCAAELIVHSDQGWHYKMQPYRAMLVRRGVEQSMSRKGNCFDNAAIESFFGILKAEYFRLERPDSIDGSKRACVFTSTTATTSASSSGCRGSVRWDTG